MVTKLTQRCYIKEASANLKQKLFCLFWSADTALLQFVVSLTEILVGSLMFSNSINGWDHRLYSVIRLVVPEPWQLGLIFVFVGIASLWVLLYGFAFRLAALTVACTSAIIWSGLAVMVFMTAIPWAAVCVPIASISLASWWLFVRTLTDER